MIRRLLLLSACILNADLATAMELTSTAFKNDGLIPAGHSYHGGNISPPLTIAGVPAGAASLALICDDPDAPAGTWVHWVVWNLDPKTLRNARTRFRASTCRGGPDRYISFSLSGKNSR